MTFVSFSKPSISARIWFRVCSRSSWPPPMPAPRLRPIESSSSMKMIEGACLRASSKRVRTRLHREERHPGLAGHRPGEQGLAGARRAHEEHPLGDLGPELAVLLGVFQELDDLLELLLGLLVAGDVGEGGLHPAFGAVEPGPGLAELGDLPHAPLAAHEEEPEESDQKQRGAEVEQELGPDRGALGLDHDPVFLEELEELPVAHRRGRQVHDKALGHHAAGGGGEPLGLFELAGDPGVAEHHPGHLALGDQGLELGVGDLRGRARGELGEEPVAEDEEEDRNPRVESVRQRLPSRAHGTRCVS